MGSGLYYEAATRITQPDRTIKGKRRKVKQRKQVGRESKNRTSVGSIGRALLVASPAHGEQSSEASVGGVVWWQQ